MDSASFGGTDNSAAVERLVGSGLRTFRVHRGDSLAVALSSPVGMESLDIDVDHRTSVPLIPPVTLSMSEQKTLFGGMNRAGDEMAPGEVAD